MLLAKTNKWEGKALDNEEKLAKGIQELNKNSRHLEVLEEAPRKLKAEVKTYNHKLNDTKDTFSREQEKPRYELNAMTK